MSFGAKLKQTFKTFWKLLLAAVLIDLPIRLFEHRILGAINEFIDRHSNVVLGYLRPVLIWLVRTPLVIPVVVICAIGIHWYVLRLADHEKGPIKEAVDSISSTDRIDLLPAGKTGVTQTANPTITQTVNLGMSPEQLAPLVRRQSAPTMGTARRESKIIFKGAKKILVRPSPEDVFFEDQLNGLPALVARFKNEGVPGKQGEYFEYVKASITFMDSSGEELGEISRLAWLGERLDLVDFGVNDSHSVILTIFHDTGHLVPFFRRSEATDGFGGEHVQLESYALGSAVEKLVVSLVADNRVLIEPISVLLA